MSKTVVGQTFNGKWLVVEDGDHWEGNIFHDCILESRIRHNLVFKDNLIDGCTFTGNGWPSHWRHK